MLVEQGYPTTEAEAKEAAEPGVVAEFLEARRITNLVEAGKAVDPGDIGAYISRDYLAVREPGLMAGQRIHGAPVVPVEAAAPAPGVLHLAAVGRPGARAEIRRRAASVGLRDGEDLIAVA